MNAPPIPQPGYIKALDGAPLYCVYHPARPVTTPQRRHYPVLLLPPLFEERKSAYASLRRLALRLAAAGHAALRFDYRGSGESGGVPAARRWQHLAEDCAVARKTLARLSGQRDAALLGLRLGATLALQETIRAGGEAVLALAPVLKGATQVRLWKMRSKIRSELTVGAPASSRLEAGAPLTGAGAGEPPAPQQHAEVFDFDGFDVSKDFFDDVARIDLIKDLSTLSCPGLVMQLSHRSEAAPETVELMKVLGSRAKNICLRMEPFWENVDDVETAPMEEAVLNWLKQI